MAFFDMVLIGVGLAADAFAAAVVRGLRIGRLRAACLASTALTFAFFQGAMTLAGYYAGELLASGLEKWSGILGAILLFFLGGRMLFAAEEEEPSLHLISMGFATSVDASVVGMAFSLRPSVSVFHLCAVIAAVTLVLSLLGFALGCAFGGRFRKTARIGGALVLIAMGARFLIG